MSRRARLRITDSDDEEDEAEKQLSQTSQTSNIIEQDDRTNTASNSVGLRGVQQPPLPPCDDLAIPFAIDALPPKPIIGVSKAVQVFFAGSSFDS